MDFPEIYAEYRNFLRSLMDRNEDKEFGNPDTEIGDELARYVAQSVPKDARNVIEGYAMLHLAPEELAFLLWYCNRMKLVNMFPSLAAKRLREGDFDPELHKLLARYDVELASEVEREVKQRKLVLVS